MELNVLNEGHILGVKEVACRRFTILRNLQVSKVIVQVEGKETSTVQADQGVSVPRRETHSAMLDGVRIV